MILLEQKDMQVELGSYIGKLLRNSFGKGPGSVFVSIDNFIITVYLRNFISPTEAILMSQNQENLVQQTRDTLMHSLIPEIKAYVQILTGMDIHEFYYDWALHNKSGLFVCICDDTANSELIMNSQYDGKEQIHKEIERISREAQKTPEEVHSYLLNPRTLIVIRKGILVRIEKELIRMGYHETLRLAKRHLEKGLLHNNSHFESILRTKVQDLFVDWDFNLNKSTIVLILKPNE